MTRLGRLGFVGGAAIGLLAVTWQPGDLVQATRAAQQDATQYTPIAPASSIHKTLQMNLKLAEDWLDQKDLQSVTKEAQLLFLLGQLYGYQSTQPSFRERTDRLMKAIGKLVVGARTKNSKGCGEAIKECHSILEEMAKEPPSGKDKVVEKNFKGFGAVRTWMLLMDGTYADAKTARSAGELEQLALALAEEANASRHVRREARWEKWSDEMREAALQTAATARSKDLLEAKKQLKAVYQACEACHQGYRR